MRRTLILLIALFCAVGLADAKTTKKNSTQTIKVACVGNSITYGYLLDNREVNSYPSQLQTMLGSGYEVGNFGRNSATLLEKGSLPYVSLPQYADALAMKADVVIIHLGINDTDPRNYPIYREQFVGDYLRLIESFRAANPSTQIYIAQLTPIAHRHPRFNAGTLDWYNKIQSDILSVADSAQVYLIDFKEPLYRRPDLLPDAVHPDVEGARLLARTAYQAVSGDYGGLSMPVLYGDNMVLQRSDKTKIEGTANRNAVVDVELSNGVKAQTVTDHYGRWSVELPLVKADTSLTLTVASQDKTLQYNNVAIGQVWVLSGQSNMSWQVANSTSPADARVNPNIRLFRMDPVMGVPSSLSAEEMDRLNELDFIGCDGWKMADRKEINEFSAIGYYFAQMICDTLNEPIGLVQTSLGGTTAESFVSRSRLENNAEIRPVLYDPHNNPLIMQWCREVMAESIGERTGTLQRHPFEPAYLYESRIYPLRNHSIAGVLWYQGESNAENAEFHERLFPEVVASFRDAFDNEDLPFYFVQLAEMTSRPSWGYFRESQARLSEKIPNCSMVISRDYTDLNDVHPPIKRPIGERLARVALDEIYNDKK